MSKWDDVSEVLEGPVGWVVVVAVGAIVLYVGIKAIDDELEKEWAAFQDWLKGIPGSVGNAVGGAAASINSNVAPISTLCNCQIPGGCGANIGCAMC